MFVEHVGTKTLLLAFDPARVMHDEEGRPFLMLQNQSTETRAIIPASLSATLPQEPCMLRLEGDAHLHVSIDDDCMVRGYEEIIASDISVSDNAMRDTDFVTEIPF